MTLLVLAMVLVTGSASTTQTTITHAQVRSLLGSAAVRLKEAEGPDRTEARTEDSRRNTWGRDNNILLLVRD